ncbi:hypothetical protein B4U80_12204, partial [Leptotrombidium deliense]
QSPRLNCGSNWKDYGNYCYWKGEKKVSFDDGVRICKQQNANLVSINDEDEYMFLTKLTKSDDYNKFWIGGRLEQRALQSTNNDNDGNNDVDDDNSLNAASTRKIYWVDNTTFSLELLSQFIFGVPYNYYYGYDHRGNACFSLFTNINTKEYATEICKQYTSSSHDEDYRHERCVRYLKRMVEREMRYRQSRKSGQMNGISVNNCTKLYYPICKRSVNAQINKQLINDLNQETLATRNTIIDHNIYENYIHKFVKLFQSKSKLLAELILLDDAPS